MLSYLRLTLLIVFVAVSAAQEESILSTEINGHHVEFQSFDDSIKTVDPQLKDLIDKQMNQIMDAIMGVIDGELDKPGSTGILGWLKNGQKLASMALAHKSQCKQLGIKYPLEKEYNTKTSNFFKGLLTDSKKLSEDPNFPRVTNQELRDQVDDYIKTLEGIANKSPVGPYVNFESGTVDGKTFASVTTDMMASLRRNGFEKFLGAIDKLLSLFAKF